MYWIELSCIKHAHTKRTKKETKKKERMHTNVTIHVSVGSTISQVGMDRLDWALHW